MARSPKPYHRYPPSYGCTLVLLLTLGLDTALAWLIYRMITHTF